MKFVKTIYVVLALALLGATAIPGAKADEWNKKTIMTFSQPVEIPGQTLPAGTYTFVLADSPSDRHIVQIFNADGTQIIATILAINNYRLKPTGDSVVKFAERTGDNPEALKAWFYPGDNFGQEFVYPKQRALQLAGAMKEPILALQSDTSDLRVAPIVAITPEQKEVPATEAAQTTAATEQVAPRTEVAAAETPKEEMRETPKQEMKEDAELPHTASKLPLIMLLGLASLGIAFLMKRLAS